MRSPTEFEADVDTVPGTKRVEVRAATGEVT